MDRSSNVFQGGHLCDPRSPTIPLSAPLLCHAPDAIEAIPSYGADEFLETVTEDHPEAWTIVVGFFFQDSKRAPTNVGRGKPPHPLTQQWMGLRPAKAGSDGQKPRLISEKWLELIHEADFVGIVSYIQDGR